MRNNFLFAFAALLATLPVPPLRAQSGPATVKLNVDEVLLDVVVRDRKGKPISDLKPGEITVNDNGAKQTLTAFRLVRGSEVVSVNGSTTKLDPLRQIRLVVLAFENLGDIDQRRQARAAALDLVRGTETPNTFFSVVVLNTRLLALQQFTSDKKLLEDAVNQATGGLSSTKLISESERVTGDLLRVLGPQPATSQTTAAVVAAVNAEAQNGSATTGANAGGFGTAAVNRMLSDLMLNVLRSEQASAGNGSRMTLSALKSLILGLQPLPGRKSVVYFSPGLYIPSELDVPFNNLVSFANRANTTFYTVDPRGVMVGALNAGANSELTGAAGAAGVTATRASGAVSRDEALALGNAEGSARANTSLKMRELAASTGGFLIGDSNDLRVPLRQVSEEIGSYYEVSYNPGIQSYDGSFRKISVSSSRKDVVIHSRNGYFALPQEARQAGIEGFELPLLTALAEGGQSEAVPFRAGVVLLKPGSETGGISILVDIPLHSLEGKEDRLKKTTAVHCSIAAVVKNATGEVVRKVTRDRSFQVTPDQYKFGNFVEKAQLGLAAGKYTLETAVMDRESGKIGTKRTQFTIAPKTAGIAISSLTPVRSYTPNAKDLVADDPFQFQGGSITPTLETGITKGPNTAVRFFFTIYADPSIADKPVVEVEILQGGKALAKTPLELPAADASGRIPYVMTIPAASIPAGVYQLHAIAKQGSTTAEARSVLRIQDAQ